MGVASPAGVGLMEFHAAQFGGRSGVRAIRSYEAAGDGVRIAGEVDIPADMDLARREALKTDRCTRLAAAATRQALEDANIADVSELDRARVGVVIGSGVGGATSAEQNYLTYFREGPDGLRARAIPMAMINDASAWVAINYGFRGPCTTVATACASGADAIVAGYQMIALGEADIVLAGGTDAPITRTIVSGFDKLGALSRRNDDPAGASRPFSADRTGFVIAEGSAVVVLESEKSARARGVRAHAELRGFGRTSDAHHVTMPHPDGRGACEAMLQALRSADAAPGDVRMVNAHGTSTTLNDAIEARAVRAALGTASAPVTATKSLIGHTLGAAGAIEAVATVQALASGMIPPVLNLEDVDPEIELDLVRGEARKMAPGLALSNSFAFGGHNVVLAFAPA
ncbi:beta-ketoacyl-ACP synthase II [Modestobacter sp. I12A-02628]|uniref:Beta-ketoacyl-[acyl-carrier-protein] synthase family protein n=2 Tax=Goekera deserti TaxID=2497753 RepID=A0A7K3WFV1_9ACTN|nr:beta-ketoacyl-ACP synthase II [Goekera deserti]NDI46804.1 beta-ketoacyl-ACP synthase II [Goekera deserti]NEL54373.1 beta-ketoacyl-[acyl-carrier-protein] synthase family protein [Goekera deserti]